MIYFFFNKLIIMNVDIYIGKYIFNIVFNFQLLSI